jgi:hypothetical protein
VFDIVAYRIFSITTHPTAHLDRACPGHPRGSVTAGLTDFTGKYWFPPTTTGGRGTAWMAGSRPAKVNSFFPFTNPDYSSGLTGMVQTADMM